MSPIFWMPAKGSALEEPLVSFCLGIALMSPLLSRLRAFPLIELTDLPRASAISSTNDPPFTIVVKVASSSGE